MLTMCGREKSYLRGGIFALQYGEVENVRYVWYKGKKPFFLTLWSLQNMFTLKVWSEEILRSVCKYG